MSWALCAASMTRSTPSAADAASSFTLRIERSMAGLAQLGGWVDQVTAALGLDQTAEYALRLCLEEAAANVVMHGETDADADGEAGFIVVRADAVQDVLRVTIEDRCGAFDPLDVAAPELPRSPEEAQVGGMGIHLMRQYARALNYERAGDVNRLTITLGRTS
jgi:anti-sigma regulatory factor (Ser/Thr protein kinase)